MTLKAWCERSILIAALALGGAAGAFAQVTTGSVTGTVKDAQGGVIPGATVTLVRESQNNRSTPVVTSATGDFTFVNVTPDTYTIEVSMPSFRLLRRTGVPVSPGERVSIGTLVIEVGGQSETVEVKSDAPLIQASSGERSFTVETESVQDLPLNGRSFTQLAALAPGVTGTSRVGDTSSTGGGDSNVMMDGVTTMDTGSNRALIDINVESIAEVKVLVSNYQAEYGRSSGLQIAAVTKSGTNKFHGSLYDVERNSDWNANSQVNILNGDPKAVSKQRDWGYSVGGPVGKPGGSNKLFFFYTQEFEPRTGGNTVTTYRMPTALERQGDFSKTTDNNGALYPYVKNPLVSGTCSATSQAACFKDGGVLGRIPAAQLYPIGLNILNMWPMPNIANVPAGQNYNYTTTSPNQSILSDEPAVRMDYQPSSALRASVKYSGFFQRTQTQYGTIPGFNDTRMVSPHVSLLSSTVDYTLSPTVFLEGTFGHSLAYQGGCFGVGSNSGPQFCNAWAMNDNADKNNIGLGNLPLIYPDSNVINPEYFVYSLLQRTGSPMWDGTRVLLPPSFSFGSRVANAPPNLGFASNNILTSTDLSLSVTKVWGPHTMKAGFYNTHSDKQQGGGNGSPSINFQQDAVGTDPCDTSFGFANAAIGCFSSYSQTSTSIEGDYLYTNTEGYLQDNWKVSHSLTLDYGVRLVHQTPQYDSRGQASNFFPDQWTLSAAPMLYVAGCANGTYPCSGTNRQAQNPKTGQFLGPNSSLAIGTVVPSTGNLTNGLVQAGQGIPITSYTYPAIGAEPRFGMAYDLTGSQKIVFRGGGGLFFDRPSGNAVFSQTNNPPARTSTTIHFAQLQTLNTGGVATTGASSLSVQQYNQALPSTWQWNGGVQIALPGSTVVDVSYTGQHGYNIVQGTNLNAVDIGAAFLPQNQDPTLTPTTPGATALSSDQLRAIRGYGSITENGGIGWVTSHSLQVSFNRRFKNGLSFTFNDTFGLYSWGNAALRYQHNADGTVSVRSDQAAAQQLLGNNNPQSQILKATFVWALPRLTASGAAWRAVGLVVNDWQLSGIWSGATAGAYTVSNNYQNGATSVNVTGSPDYAARIVLVGSPGSGCSSNPEQQFNPAAFNGPAVGSVGLDSGSNYLHGCFASALDLSIARNIVLGKGRAVQLRVDMFNAPNEAGITGRNTTMTLNSVADPVTINNLPYDANGNLIASKSLPRGAGFGVATTYQSSRAVQAQIRFSF